MVQVAVAGATGVLAHRRAGNIDLSLGLTMGGAMTVGALAGGLTSGLVPPPHLTGLFAATAAVAAGLMLAGRRVAAPEIAEGPIVYNVPAAVVMGFVIGLLMGTVGAGGGFLLVPVLVVLLRVPVRVAIGTTLAIVAAGGIAGGVGKAATGQIDWMLALALVVGALPGAHAGARVSRRLPVRLLTPLLGLLIGGIAAKMWWDLLKTP
jgi:uncharacterized membrane protein YfcA